MTRAETKVQAARDSLRRDEERLSCINAGKPLDFDRESEIEACIEDDARELIGEMEALRAELRMSDHERDCFARIKGIDAEIEALESGYGIERATPPSSSAGTAQGKGAL